MSKQEEYLKIVTERLLNQIKENKAPWQRPFKQGDYTNSHIPISVNGRPYRGMNMLNLMSISSEKNYNDNRWATMKKANELGAKVKKGEKGTDVYYWKFDDTRNKKNEKGENILDQNGKPIKEHFKLDKPQVFFAKVFNAEQFESFPEKHNFPKFEEWERHEIAERIIKAANVEIIHQVGENAYYSPTKDKIVLPERSQFDTADLYYATALHELGHATGHVERLNRDLTGSFGSESYAKEELRAEISSMMIGQELEIGHDPQQHYAYLQSWAKIIENDPKEIFKAVKDADKITNYLLSFTPEIEKIRNERLQIIEADISSVAEQNSEKERLEASLRIYLNVDFSEKEEVKKLGAKWDKNEKSWYVPNDLDPEKFKRWHIITNDQDQKQKSVLDSAFVSLKHQNENVIPEHRNNDANMDKLYFDDVALSNLDLKIKLENKELILNAYQIEPNKFEIEVNDYDREDQYTSNQALEDFGLKTTLNFQQTFSEAEVKNLYTSLVNKDSKGLTPDLSNNINPKDAKKDQRVFLNVDFSEKNEAKKLGAKWDTENKAWYVTDKDDLSKFDKWLNSSEPQKVYLYTSVEDKTELKDLGAKWDTENKAWYVTDKDDLSKFDKWLNAPHVPTPIEAFKAYLTEQNLKIVGEPKTDGKAHRISNEGSDSKNVMYQFSLNSKGTGGVARITNFSRDGIPQQWLYPSEYLKQQDHIELVDQLNGYERQKPNSINNELDNDNKTIKDNSSIEVHEVHKETARKVQELFTFLPVAPNENPYLERKSVSSNNLVRVIPSADKLPNELKNDFVIANDWREAQSLRESSEERIILQKGNLAVPKFDQSGDLKSYETISSYNGAKYVLKDSQNKGVFLELGNIENGKPFILCEGYATGATLHEKADNIGTVITFGKDNMQEIAKIFRDKYPDSKIYIGADNDHNKPENAGLKSAEKIAKSIDAYILVPSFSSNEKGKDWNDIYVDKGHDFFRQNLKNELLKSKSLENVVQQKKNIDLSQLSLAQQKPLRNFIFAIEQNLKDDPQKLNKALEHLESKIPDVLSGKIKLTDINLQQKQSDSKDIGR